MPANLLRSSGIRLYRFAHVRNQPLGMLTIRDTSDAQPWKDANMNMDLSNMHLSRTKVIQIWFAAMVLAGIAAIALGASVSMGTAVVLVATCFVPPAILLMLWRPDNTPTMAETIRDAKTR